MAAEAELISFESRTAMASRLADVIEAQLARSLAEKERATLAVSGGSTPKALYETLAARDLPWNNIRLTLVDERWVPSDHPRSNEAFVEGSFAAASGVRVQGLYNGAASPHDGVASVAETLDGLQKTFDVVVLGMGDDGHTASWFPHAEGLTDALAGDAWVCAVRAMQSDVTGEEVDRLTLTLSAIKDARLIILLLAGETKRRTFERALEDGPVEDMPVRAILRARPDLWVCWAP